MSDSHHGNTPAAWTFVTLAMLGFVVGGVAMLLDPISWPIFLSRSLPLRQRTPANIGPAPYIQMAGLAPSTISPIAQQTLEGAGVPPISAKVLSRQYSASIHVW